MIAIVKKALSLLLLVCIGAASFGCTTVNNPPKDVIVEKQPENKTVVIEKRSEPKTEVIIEKH